MSEKLWGGRFTADVTQDVLLYTETTKIDRRLIEYDILGSMAHLLMLYDQAIIERHDAEAIAGALLELHSKAIEGRIELSVELEDVHLNLESQVIQATGREVGGRLHTARSRNDQVCVDTRMYLREELHTIIADILDFIDYLLSRALVETETVAVGYTHGQPAQPISLGFWLSAYASIYSRDVGRLLKALATVNESPLGACALAGTSFPIDRSTTAKFLGFPRVIQHSLDATSSRDFATETLSAFALVMANHSKMAEEIVVWSSFEFGLIDLSDAFCTGSSIMPQKKNPVVAELAKGRAGRVFGALVQNLTMMKGVGTGYNCDLQEDKPLLWDSIDTVKTTTTIMKKQIETATYNSERATDLCWENFSTITELANWLTTQCNIPFREAHRITGELTQFLIEKKATPRAFADSAEFLSSKGIAISTADLEKTLDPREILAKQNSLGGTSPTSVTALCHELSISLQADRQALQASVERVSSSKTALLLAAHALHRGH